MTTRSADEIRAAVSAAYGARARALAEGTGAACCGDDCCTEHPDESRVAGQAGRLYAAAETAGLPETVVSYGCGNPTAIAGLQPGEVVLDLGSGAGLDCFLSAKQVGPTGRVIGLDMTDEMLTLAETNKAKLGVTNVEFKRGVMEAMPLPDAGIDVIISNCVINLSPDKDAVFREAFRVLRPGGRVHVSDVVLLRDLAPAEQDDLNLWAGCIAGALERGDYAARLVRAGFSDIAIDLAEVSGEEADKPYRSALITARRPGGSKAAPKPWLTGARIELLAPAGLETAACCTTDEAGKTTCC